MKKLILLTLVLLIHFYLAAQEEITKIPFTSQNMVLDGKLQESFWEGAAKFTGFKQLTPEIGEEETQSSTAYISYNEEYLFFAAVMRYDDASQVFGRTLERDISLVTDDFVEIHLDSYNDRTNSLVFKTNPLGARFDFENNRNGMDLNTSWNTFWDVATSRTEDGWIAEFRIPFKSLRFEQQPTNLMRFKVAVNYKELNEIVLFPLNDTEITGGLYHYANSALIEFENLPSTKALYVTPYAKGSVLKQSVLNKEGTAYNYETEILERKDYAENEVLDKIISNIGVDTKWKPNANNTIDFTLNTDFAQIEADDRLINISRFSIALPEKRLFFLENADLFNSNMFDHRLFQSRQIGIFQGAEIPLIGGIRYVGNDDRWQFGGLSIQTNAVDRFNLPSYNMGVLRAKRRVGNKGSYIGLINTSKIANGDYNYLFATDGNIRFTDNFDMEYVLGSTFDKIKGDFKPVYGVAFTNFKTNGFGFQYRFREYTEDFNPELGFVSQPNTKRLTLNNGYRKTYTDHKFLQYLSVGHYIRKNWISSTGAPGYFQTNLYLTMINKKGYFFNVFPLYKEDHLYGAWQIAENIIIPEDKYNMWQIEPTFNNGRSMKYQYSISGVYGGFYGGRQLSFSGNLNYDFTKNFKLEVGANYNRLSFPDSYSENGSSVININRYYSRLKFAFSSKSFVNSYLQYDTNTKKLGVNMRFRYQPREGTDLYMVYNHNVNTKPNEVLPNLNTTQDQSFIIKFSKTFIL